MEIKYEDNKVFENEVEIKKENISTEYMIAFIDRIIESSNNDTLTFSGDKTDPFQELISRVIEGASNQDFKDTIKNLEEEKNNLAKEETEIGDIDFTFNS